jgi:hypothetical protein
MPANNGGDFLGMTLNPGPHTLTATPYSGLNGTGTPGIPLTVNFTVAGPPVITSTAVTTATIGDLYTYDVEATTLTGAPLTYSLTQIPQANRGVMTIDPVTGVISWTPAIPNPNAANPLVSYSNNVTVRVTDRLGRFRNQTFTIAVSPKPETITVTQAVFHNLPLTANDSWTINGTSTVIPSNCTGTPNVCGNLTIRRTRGNALIGTVTVDGSGNWTFTKVQPGVVQVIPGDTIRVLSQTGGVINDAPITIQPN